MFNFSRSENQSSVGEITLQGKITSLDLSPGILSHACLKILVNPGSEKALNVYKLRSQH